MSLDKKDFEAVIIGWETGLDPDGYSIWHSGERFNFVSYANPDVDRVTLIEGRRTFEFQGAAGDLLQVMDAQIALDCPYVFLCCPDDLHGDSIGAFEGRPSRRPASAGISARNGGRRKVSSWLTKRR